MAHSDHKFIDMCRSANESTEALVEGMYTGYTTIGGQANFVLSKVGDSRMFLKRFSKGVSLCTFNTYGLAEFVRITIGTVA